MVTSEQIVLRQKETISVDERGAVVPYAASIHKFRVESVAIKLLKLELKVLVTALYDTVKQKLLAQGVQV